MHPRSARRTAIAATAIAIGLFATQAARADAIITPSDNIINYTGTIVDYTIQAAGIYDITATGANGGDGYNTTAGGLGITLGGDFTLAANSIIEIAVGGGGGSNDVGSGAGGSFVVLSATATPLVIAGGGAGAGYGGAGGNATLGTNTGTGVGGSASGYDSGGGGAGFSQNGSINDLGDALGGYDFGNGLAGGPGVDANGGFGGGGGGSFNGAGGGGGYDGGSGGSGYGGGFGGTSYLAPSVANLVLPSTFNAGGAGANGLITINFVAGATSVPEPGSLALLATGLLGLGALTRRRKTP